jgi:hypothetical protein
MIMKKVQKYRWKLSSNCPVYNWQLEGIQDMYTIHTNHNWNRPQLETSIDAVQSRWNLQCIWQFQWVYAKECDENVKLDNESHVQNWKVECVILQKPKYEGQCQFGCLSFTVLLFISCFIESELCTNHIGFCCYTLKRYVMWKGNLVLYCIH